MHTLLLMHFDAVVPEDTAPAGAGNRSRIDFGLKKEQIAGETRMMRKGLRQAAAPDELTADQDRYQTHADCDVLVCFVYDPGRQFYKAPAFELDLNSSFGGPHIGVFVTPH